MPPPAYLSVQGVLLALVNTHERVFTREQEETKRLQLCLDAQERTQKRADRAYFGTVDRHTSPFCPIRRMVPRTGRTVAPDHTRSEPMRYRPELFEGCLVGAGPSLEP
ncbi:hypothetical protein Ndas_1332 [Nocardiopsis dassonvillei subsp. dassonvillei DSM 43111]|uniref:Uncharacterized protein n=1 Tax=Nocardiopsis dassonvillei (strain ATCC 23218 / DSM 43111 / CIP 107115 / JCM 7437 / KCTC 9190 / NBRC 14626 / NCTC 10488 / NRRL B-5397 / IMRU 509) TaxID=446468 RepID=D7B2R6_NOCDD|nr:hypothetical protein Ndas_1332 [Nocardiopsis dassonvillei subsp. dassonvillei DSM 43111]